MAKKKGPTNTEVIDMFLSDVVYPRLFDPRCYTTTTYNTVLMLSTRLRP